MTYRHTTKTYKRLYFWIFHFYESPHYVRQREKIPTGNFNQFKKKKRFELCMMAKKETDVNRNVMHRFLNVMRWQQTVFLSLCVVKLLHWAVLLFYVIVSGYDKVWCVTADCRHTKPNGWPAFLFAFVIVRSSIMHCVLIV